MDYLAAKYRLSSYKVDILVASYGCFSINDSMIDLFFHYVIFAEFKFIETLYSDVIL